MYGEPLAAMSIKAFRSVGIDEIYVAVPKGDSEVRIALSDYGVNFFEGGASRTESVKNGLKAIAHLSPEIVSIHDGARPFVSKDVIVRTIQSARQFSSGVAAVKTTDFIVSNRDGYTPLDRDYLYNIQTPQSFSYAALKQAYNEFEGDAFDDSSVFAKFKEVRLVEGDYENIKLTRPNDFALRSARAGVGYDVHKLVSGRKLILCGVEVPYELGLLGHSDADVATHAVMDALLSAAALPDIGTLFPDTSSEYKNADSIELLKRVHNKIDGLDFAVGNVSVTIAAEKPKLFAYKDEMRRRLAAALQTDVQTIAVAATTTEGLGIIGNSAGMAAFAVATLVRKHI